MAKYLQTHGGVPLDHPRKCQARRQDGKPCRRYAIRGGNVCRVHGGGSPQVIAKARERLALAADRMARELLGIATGAESEAVKLAAVKDALDRAGLNVKQALELSAKPWEDIMSDVAGVATISRAESRARRGLPDDAPAPAEPLDIVDAEVVDDAEPPAYPPDVDGATRTGDGRVTGAEPPTAPRSGQLVPLDDAAHDAAQANRRAKAHRVR